jgi:hypothetical protein
VAISARPKAIKRTSTYVRAAAARGIFAALHDIELIGKKGGD